MRSLLLLSIVFISGCVIAPSYLSSEAEISLLQSGKPAPYKTVTREIYSTVDSILEKQISVSDKNGIVRFKEVRRRTSVIWWGKKIYSIHYYIVTDQGYDLIDQYHKFGTGRFSDIRRDCNDKDRCEDTIRYFEFDLDTLYVKDVE